MFNTSKFCTNTVKLNSFETVPHTFFMLLVGYFNYRYFCNFLFYTFLGMFYGAIIAYRPFRAMSGLRNRHGNNIEDTGPWAPTPEEGTYIAFSFMLCLSVGLAVATLAGFHAYLLLTAQTTIEFHGESLV